MCQSVQRPSQVPLNLPSGGTIPSLSKVGRAGPKPHRASNGIERAFPFLDCTSDLVATLDWYEHTPISTSPPPRVRPWNLVFHPCRSSTFIGEDPNSGSNSPSPDENLATHPSFKEEFNPSAHDESLESYFALRRFRPAPDPPTSLPSPPGARRIRA